LNIAKLKRPVIEFNQPCEGSVKSSSSQTTYNSLGSKLKVTAEPSKPLVSGHGAYPER
jgi:hypothetical protein